MDKAGFGVQTSPKPATSLVLGRLYFVVRGAWLVLIVLDGLKQKGAEADVISSLCQGWCIIEICLLELAGEVIGAGRR